MTPIHAVIVMSPDSVAWCATACALSSCIAYTTRAVRGSARARASHRAIVTARSGRQQRAPMTVECAYARRRGHNRRGHDVLTEIFFRARVARVVVNYDVRASRTSLQHKGFPLRCDDVPLFVRLSLLSLRVTQSAWRVDVAMRGIVHLLLTNTNSLTVA
jgi:hypothetical protein